MMQPWTMAVVAAVLAALPCAPVKPRTAGKPIGNTLDMLFVAIPPGKFTMGSPADEPGRQATETQHEVEIKEPFYLGVHEVTVGQFRRFVEATGYKTTAETNGVGGLGYNARSHQLEKNPRFNWKNPGYEQTDDHPAVLVSWHDAKAFCRWLSKKEDRVYRLPTEAEWEYVCRAGSNTRFPFGDDETKIVDYGNIADATLKALDAKAETLDGFDGHLFPAAACSYQPNAWGLYDMIGNAAEWCEDWFLPYGSSQANDPKFDPANQEKVARGGAWCLAPRRCRSAARAGMKPDYASIGGGFRVVCENPKP